MLDALAAWLDQEPPRVEQRLVEPSALTRLVTLLPSGLGTTAPSGGALGSGSGGAGGESDVLQGLLASLLRLLAKSPRLSVELAQNGLAPRVVSLQGAPLPRGAVGKPVPGRSPIRGECSAALRSCSRSAGSAARGPAIIDAHLPHNRWSCSSGRVPPRR